MDLRKSGISSFKQCAINASPLLRRYAIKKLKNCHLETMSLSAIIRK